MIEKDLNPLNDKLTGIYRGVVVDNNDPDTGGKIRVRIYGVMASTDIPTAALPWAVPAYPITDGSGNGYGTFRVPNVNSRVWVFFENGDYTDPVYLAEAPDGVNGLPEFRTTNYPNRIGYKTSNGVIFYIDRSDDEMKLEHPSGVYYKVDSNGDMTINIVRDWLSTIGRDMVRSIGRDWLETIDRDLLFSVTGVASVVDFHDERIVPPGTGPVPTFLSTEPSGWIFMYGQSLGLTGSSVSGEKYEDLFNVLKNVYPNSGSEVWGSTSIIVPDMRGLIPMGATNIGGSVSSTWVTNTLARTLGRAFGEEYHQLIVSELARHRHGVYSRGGSEGASNFPWIGQTNTPLVLRYSEYEGNDVPHNNMQPTIPLNMMVKY